LHSLSHPGPIIPAGIFIILPEEQHVRFPDASGKNFPEASENIPRCEHTPTKKPPRENPPDGMKSV